MIIWVILDKFYNLGKEMEFFMLSRKLISTLFFSLLIYCFTQIGFAYNQNSIARIKQLTKEYIQKNVQLNSDETMNITIDSPKASFKIPPCSEPLDIAFPNNATGNRITSVELTCKTPKTWHLLVPVTVQINTKVLVAKHNIPSKEIITEVDLDYAFQDKNRLYNGFFKDKKEVLGQVASHMISSGTVITKKNIQMPIIIHRNQKISLFTKKNSIVVTMDGIAREDGSLNSTIKVFNPSSKRVLEAVVTGSNKAEIIS